MIRERSIAYLWGMGLCALSAWPVLRDPPIDSFPLSTYPMFSERRDQPWIHQIVAIDSSGAKKPLPPALVANAETLQAAAAIRRAVDRGPDAMRALCRQVAARAATAPEFADARRLQIQAMRYDPVDYFRVGPEALSSRVLMRCRVPR